MISTKGRYAVRVMIDLAENGKEHAIPLKDIAARQEISKKYLQIASSRSASFPVSAATSWSLMKQATAS